MGDGATPEPLLLAIHENVACKDRPAGARGSCYSFEYTPGNELWAGVYWQHPANNWGADPGLPVVGERLTQVTFQAAVAEGPETIEFVIGGIGVPRQAGEADLFPNNDQMKQLAAVDVTTEFQRFEIPIPTGLNDSPITSLLGAFAWFAKYPPMSDPATLPPKTIYIDDLAYE